MILVRGTGKYHTMYHRSRTYPWRGVANCGFTAEISSLDRVRDEAMCKHCARGVTPFVKKLFDGIRVSI